MSHSQRVRAVWLTIFMVGCFSIMAYYFSLAGTRLLPGGDHYEVQAIVPNAVSLASAADVRVAGVNVGKVKDIKQRGDATIIGLDIDREHEPIYQDARVLVRAKSVAGENYVEIETGSKVAGALPDGGVLGIEHADEATQIDELFSVFDSTRRRDLQRTLAGLAGGLETGGGRDLNRTLEATAAVPTDGADAAEVLGGNSAEVARLIDSFGIVAAALGERGQSIRTFTRQAKATAEAVETRDVQLRAMLSALPPFLSQTRATSNRLETVANVATPVVRDLRLATTDLVPAVRDLEPAAREGVVLAKELERFAGAARPATRRLKPFSENGGKVLAPLEAFLRQGNPMFAYVKPYYREISTFFALPSASFSGFDAIGHRARIILPVSRSNAAGALTPAQDKLLQQLSGPLDTRGSNPYPKPTRAGASEPHDGTYKRLTADPPYTK